MADQQLGTATLDVRADTGPLKRDLADAKRTSEKATRDIQRGMDKASKVAGVALLGLGAAAWKATQGASDLGESMNKARQTFGAAAKDMPGMMGSVAESLGMARAEALDSAAGIGAMLIPMGLSQREAARMSSRMTTLAADLGSFHNADPTEMLDRLRAGLSGESEPLKRFGIVLSEARVQAEAFRMGIAEQGATLTDAQKIQARYSLAISDAGKANGDFARTADGLANQQRILKAEVTDLAASFGSTFVPVAGAVVAVLRDAAGWMERNRTATLAVAGTVGGLAAAVIAVNGAMRAYAATTAAATALQGLFVARTATATTATVAQTGAQRGLNAAMRANPIGIVLTALALLAGAVLLAYQRSATFRTVAGNAFKAVGAAAEVTTEVVQGVAKGIGKILAAGRDLLEFWNQLRGKGGSTTKDVVKGLEQVQTATRQTAGSAKGAAADYVKGLRTMGQGASTVAVTNNTLGKSTERLADTFARKWQGSADKVVTSMAGTKAKAAEAGPQVGTSWMAGIQSGITSQQGVLNAAFARAVSEGIAAGRAAARAKSPSKETEEKIGDPMMAGMRHAMEKPAAKKRLALAMTSAVRDAVRGARANVPSLIGSLISSVTQAIDAQLAGALAKYDPENGAEAAGLRGMLGARDARQTARTEAGLHKAIADATKALNAKGPEDETPEAKAERVAQAQQQLTDAVIALNDWQADQAIAAEERRLADLRTQLETEHNDRKATAERNLAVLGDEFARGLVKGGEFTKRLNAILGEAEAPIASTGALLGEAFRRAFLDQFNAVKDQVTAVLVGPKGKGNPLAPEVQRPLAVQHAEWAERRRVLAANYARLQREAKAEGSPGKTAITADERKAIDAAKDALATWDRRQPQARKLALGGILTRPTYGMLAEAGYPEAAITLDGSQRSWQLLADAQSLMPARGANAGRTGPLVHVAQLVVRNPEDVALVAARLSTHLASQGVRS